MRLWGGKDGEIYKEAKQDGTQTRRADEVRCKNRRH